MGSITTGVGLISGINTAQLIDSLIALESGNKLLLQKRVSTLTSQRTALMDINARLLNLKNAAKAFRLDKIFQSGVATSSDDEVLTAIAGKGAQPGTYQFIVKQLVGTSQKLTQGFADRNSTPLGLTSLSFEFGKGNLSVDRDLEQINGGAGIDRGRIKITDRTGTEATIDLTDVTTINEVVDRINGASTIQVTASLQGDHLLITDTSGASASNLIVANALGDTTATDLGIAASVAASAITGTNINTVGATTSLASLNDGNGVLTRNNVADFTITARDGTQLSIDLGRVNKPITNATLLADLNNGLGITISDDDENPDFKIVDRNGDTHEVNLNGITTVGGLINRVTSETTGKVTLSIHTDGNKLVVTDNTGQTTSNLKVLGGGVNGTKTATELGILNVAGVAAATFPGQVIPNTITDPAASKISDVLNRINSATNNGGKIVASLAPDGVSLLITDTTAGPSNLIIRRTASNQYAASQLGIETSVTGVAADTIDGTRLIASLGSVMVKNLNGGAGLAGETALAIKDRNGGLANFTLDENASLSDIIAQINNSIDVDVTASLNSAGNGLKIVDNTGGIENLVINGNAAAKLGIAADVANSSVRGTNLQHRYVSEAKPLKDLNYGRGVGNGRFRITDVTGASEIVDIGSDSINLQDVIEEINSRGLAINARVNDNGDGLLIETSLGVGQSATVKLKIESVSGTAGRDLNIIGTSETVDNAKIDGSYERTVALSDSDTLDKVVNKINAAGLPVGASVINAGSGATPFRINFTSKISGMTGELVIDGGDVDLGLTTLTKGQNAKVFFGSDSAEDGFLVTSATNSITSILDGVTIDLHKVSEDPVTLTIAKDTSKIVGSVKQLFTAFNDVIGRIKQYDFFDVDTETRGPLLSNPTTGRIREAMYRTIQSPAFGVTTQYKFLREIGMTIGQDGQARLDEVKFQQALERDPQAVENLFAAYQAAAATPQQIEPGITVTPSNPTVTVRGVGEVFDLVLEGLTNSIDGAVTLADRGFRDQIEAANRRISDFDQRLEAKRRRLQAQFAAMESALSRMQSQTVAINSLAALVAQQNRQ